MNKLRLLTIASLGFCTASYADITSLSICEQDPSVHIGMDRPSGLYPLNNKCNSVDIKKYCRPDPVRKEYDCGISVLNGFSRQGGEVYLPVADNQVFIDSHFTSDYYIQPRNGQYYIVHY